MHHITNRGADVFTSAPCPSYNLPGLSDRLTRHMPAGSWFLKCVAALLIWNTIGLCVTLNGRIRECTHKVRSESGPTSRWSKESCWPRVCRRRCCPEDQACQYNPQAFLDLLVPRDYARKLCTVRCPILSLVPCQCIPPELPPRLILSRPPLNPSPVIPSR